MPTPRNLSPEQQDWILNTWIPALESGHYLKTERFLQDEQGFCCLGVACELLQEPLGITIEHQEDDDDDSILPCWIYDGEGGVLPASVTTFLGISCEGRFRDEDGTLINLTDINDSSSSFGPVIEAIRYATLNQRFVR